MKAVEHYLAHRKPSQAVKNEQLAEERAKRKVAKSNVTKANSKDN